MIVYPHVVVSNLVKRNFDEDLKDIERVVVEYIFKMRDEFCLNNIFKEDVSFSFPFEPNLTPEGVSVVVFVRDIMGGTRIDRNRLASMISRALRDEVLNREVRVKVERFDVDEDGYFVARCDN